MAAIQLICQRSSNAALDGRERASTFWKYLGHFAQFFFAVTLASKRRV
jgi:hypothetical protein